MSALDASRDRAEVKCLGIARILVGTIFLIRTTPLLYLFPGLLKNHGGPLFGWPEPGWRVAYGDLVLPDPLIWSLVGIRTIAAALFTFGVWARPAGIVAATAAYLVYAQEPFAFIFTLHVLYLSTFLLATTDAASVAVLVPSTLRSPASSLMLIRCFVASVYFWSAVAKMRGSWLDGSTILSFHRDGYTTGALSAWLFATGARCKVMAWTTVLTEALLAPGLLYGPTRLFAVVVACVLHASLELTVHPDVFGLVMVALLSAFWPTNPERTDRSAPALDARGISSSGKEREGMGRARGGWGKSKDCIKRRREGE